MLGQVPWADGFERLDTLLEEVDEEVSQVSGVGFECIGCEAALDTEIGEESRGGGVKGFGYGRGAHREVRIGE